MYAAAGVVTVDGAVPSAYTVSEYSLAPPDHIRQPHGRHWHKPPACWSGVSWNCGAGTTDRTITSVTFTPSGSSALNLSLVKKQQAGTQLRYAAIYSLLNPPSGQAGTVTVTFSGSVSNGIVAGIANFKGVDQWTPLGTANGAGSTSQGTTPSVDLTGLNGDELVFDTVFQGASDVSQTLTAGSGQTERWNAFIGNTRAAASTEQATTASITMSWTAASSSYWAIAAVPINPAVTYSLTYTAGANGSISGSSPQTVDYGAEDRGNGGGRYRLSLRSWSDAFTARPHTIRDG